MLTPELRKLKESLENNTSMTNKSKLLKELTELDNGEIIFLESLALSNDRCKTCGRIF